MGGENSLHIHSVVLTVNNIQQNTITNLKLHCLLFGAFEQSHVYIATRVLSIHTSYTLSESHQFAQIFLTCVGTTYQSIMLSIVFCQVQTFYLMKLPNVEHNTL